MHITRKALVSAGVVGVILVGGVSVTAAASAGRVEKIWRVVESGSGPAVSPATRQTAQPQADDDASRSEPTSAPSSAPTSAPDDGSVVSRDVNPDPGSVTTYWTEQRLQEASPFPMPEADDPAGPSGSRVEGIE
ncbi:hypothetical protein ABT340_21405 [Streptosporangium sp. NPDC000239]|uniref:hypothetical protein n=1 Tax=Streptosporangium sp. NPDC000239 TaxID=3154248 RepID=UPI00331F537C